MLSACKDLLNSIEVGSTQDVDRLLQMSEVWSLDSYKTEGEEYYMIPHPLGHAIEGCGSSDVTDVFQLLIDRNFMLDTPIPRGWRPIVGAIQQGNLNVLNLLIDRGADVNWPSPTADDYPPPLSAVCLHMFKLSLDQASQFIELLCSHGAEVNPSDGPTPLHYAMTATAVKGRTGQNRLAIMRKLLELGADVNKSSRVPSFWRPANSHVGTPLHAYYGSGKEAVSLLLQAGADTSIRNNYDEDAITYIEEYITSSDEESGTAVLELLRSHQTGINSSRNKQVSGPAETTKNVSSNKNDNQGDASLLSNLLEFFKRRDRS